MNTYPQLIHRYLDGDLEHYLEEMLFAELGRNPELRQEFARQMILHQSPQKYHRKKPIPQAVRQNIFSALEAESRETMPEAVTAAIQKRLPGGTLPLIIAVILSSVATAFLMSLNSHTAVPDRAAARQVLPAGIVQAVGGAVSQTKSEYRPERKVSEPIAFAGSGRLPKANRVHEPLRLSEANRWSRPYNEIPGGKPLRVSGSQQVSINIDIAAHVPNPRTATRVRSVEAYLPDTLYTALDGSEILADTGVTAQFPFTLQVQGVREMAAAPLLNGEVSAAINVSATLLYNVAEDARVGIEVGRENFYQDYSQTVAGAEQRIGRNSSLPVFGIVYRHEFSGLSFNNFRPYAQAFAGASSEGAIAKIATGLQYSPYRNIAIAAGVETAALRYSVQQKNFMSSRIGAALGLQLSL